MDQGIYTIQLSQWVFREEPVSIEATGILTENNVEIEINGRFKYRNGGVANVSANCTRDQENRAVIRGTKGTITVF